mgnify:CR=1 FL=1
MVHTDRLLHRRGTAETMLLGAATLNAGNIHLKVLRWRVLLGTRGFSFSNRQAWRAILHASSGFPSTS